MAQLIRFPPLFRYKLAVAITVLGLAISLAAAVALFLEYPNTFHISIVGMSVSIFGALLASIRTRTW